MTDAGDTELSLMSNLKEGEIVDRYEDMANMIKGKMAKATQAEEITISMKDALTIYMYLLGMSRISRILKSEYGGADVT